MALKNEDRQEIGVPGRDAGIRLRIWPALLIVIVNLSVALAAWRFGTTNIHAMVGFIIVPILAAVLLIIWWLAASRAPVRDRWAGFALVAAVLFWVYITQKSNGELLLMAAVPTITTGVVALLAVTFWLPWPVRRWCVVALMAGCAAVFTATRADGIGSNFVPILAWRSSPTAEELVAASEGLANPKPGAMAHVPAQAGPGDWPGFRGPARDGRAEGVTFSADWSTPPRQIWRHPVGPAWSSFVVVGDYLFTQEQRGNDEAVTCYLAATGEGIWVNRVPVRFDNNMGPGPRATPAYDQGRLYTLGATGILQCLDAATGKTIWKRDVTQDAETKIPTWGFSGSPLVVVDRVIVFPGGDEGKSVVAFDRTSGDLAWRAGAATGGYSSPQLTRIAEVSQVLISCDFGLMSLVPETGASLWEHPWKTKADPRIDQPLLVDGASVILGSTAGTGRLRVQKTESAWTVATEWTVKSFRPYFNDFVCHKGHCYGLDGNRLSCIDAQTGQGRWDAIRCGGQVLLVPEIDTFLVLSEAGDVILVQAAPEKFTELARFKALNGKTWNHPVIAHGKLFVRNAEEAACFELPADPTAR
ncbi:MAG TPA: PQQ-binding-like beta-propeller repeat protein [Candidatus Bathyarchaeia archaeon]|nr:PQQ-binding-like beta-propeller repeat protein [Candidatus Bathyarchaeia archaeon]